MSIKTRVRSDSVAVEIRRSRYMSVGVMKDYKLKL
jgi:hypothetical protein